MQLAHWLRQHRVSSEKFSDDIGVKSRSTIYRYIRGERMPEPELLDRIKRHTRGHVTADDFVAAVLAYRAGKPLPGMDLAAIDAAAAAADDAAPPVAAE